MFLTVSYYAQEIGRSYDTVETGYNFDFMVSYMNISGEEAKRTNEKIAGLDGVTGTAAAETSKVIFRAENPQLSDLTRRLYAPDGKAFFLSVQLFCPDDASFDRYAATLGVDPREYRNPDDPKMILINNGQAYFDGKRTVGEILSIEPGDVLRFSSSSTGGDSAKSDVENNVKGEDATNGNGAGSEENSTELKAGLLTDQRPMGVLISSLDNITAVVSREVFDSMPDSLKSIDSNDNPSVQYLFLTSESADSKTEGSLETQMQELTQSLPGRTYVYNVAADARSERNMMLVLGIFIYGFIILISLICIANIFNTVATNIALRRREFAMLRSVGMTPGSFNRMIRFESVFYGLKALLYGLPISLAVSLLLHNMQADVFDIAFSLPWKNYCVAVAMIFIIVGSTMLYSSAKIKKENIIDALKTENM